MGMLWFLAGTVFGMVVGIVILIVGAIEYNKKGENK